MRPSAVSCFGARHIPVQVNCKDRLFLGTRNRRTTGHLLALLTVVIWGTTYISTKTLQLSFTPIEILICRFSVSMCALLLVYPHLMKHTTPRQELVLAGAGLCGICLYYLFENLALTYTTASNVGVIWCASPFFTAIFSRLFLKEKLPGLSFYLGFVIAMTGIVLISWNGMAMQLNPIGDLLALLAAVVWGAYSVLSKMTSEFEYPTILITRRIFEYGFLFTIPLAFIFGFHPEVSRIFEPVNLLNYLYLGVAATAMCFFTWNTAVKTLGPVTTSIYIYLVPVVTVTGAILILHEQMTSLAVVGTVLTLTGLICSQSNQFRRKHRVS